MGNIGWFILLYIAVGWILDILLSLALIVIAAVKDAKNGNEECLSAYGDEVEFITETAKASDSSGNGMFKAWLIGRLIWPYALPIGIYHLWQTIKEAEVKKEES